MLFIPHSSLCLCWNRLLSCASLILFSPSHDINSLSLSLSLSASGLLIRSYATQPTSKYASFIISVPHFSLFSLSHLCNQFPFYSYFPSFFSPSTFHLLLCFSLSPLNCLLLSHLSHTPTSIIHPSPLSP